MNCWVVPGAMPSSSSWTVLPVSVLGSIGSLKVTSIVSGVLIAARLAADRVERDRGRAGGRAGAGLGGRDRGDLGRMQVDVLVGTDVDERVAAVADAGDGRVGDADVAQDVADAGDRLVVVGVGVRRRARSTRWDRARQDRLPLVGEGEIARARQGHDLPRIVKLEVR